MTHDDKGRDAVRAGEQARTAALSAGLASGVASGVAEVRAHSGADLVRGVEVLEGVLEDAFERGAEAWDALRGPRHRRWPWALGSAVVGAATAVAATVVVRRLSTRDAPDALEPDQVEAVVDLRPAGAAVLQGAAVPPGAAVDEDGEAVQPR